MKKTIWKRISESQIRKKSKFWTFVAKGKFCVYSAFSNVSHVLRRFLDEMSAYAVDFWHSEVYCQCLSRN